MFRDPVEIFTHLFLSEEETEKDSVRKADRWGKERLRRFRSYRGFVEMHNRETNNWAMLQHMTGIKVYRVT